MKRHNHSRSSSRAGTIRRRSRFLGALLVLPLMAVPVVQASEPSSRHTKSTPSSAASTSATHKNHFWSNRRRSKIKRHRFQLDSTLLTSSSSYHHRPPEDYQITYQFPTDDINEDDDQVLDEFEFDLRAPPSPNKKSKDQRQPQVTPTSTNLFWNNPWTLSVLLSGLLGGIVVQQKQQKQKKQPSSYFGGIGGAITSATTTNSNNHPSKRFQRMTRKAKKAPRRAGKQSQQPWYTTPADDHPLALESETIIQKQGIFQWLMSRDKLPWTLSAIASLVYWLALWSRVHCDSTSASWMCWKPLQEMTAPLHDGFCVWGADATTGVCSSSLANSHQFSFYVDAVLAVTTLVVGHVLRPQASFVWVSGIALMMGLHGLLHLGISNGVVCSNNNDAARQWHCLLTCPHSTATPTQPWEWILYTLYNLGLVAVDIQLANLRLPRLFQCAVILLVTALFVASGVYVGATWALSAVFVQSHVLVSLTGLFANADKITPLMGWCFLAATCVGLTEFVACQPLLMHVYGHVAYDTVLHLAMMTSLIPSGRKAVQ